MANKDVYYMEIDIAFQVYRLINDIDYSSWHRILSIVEQLKQEEQKKIDEIQRAVYAAGRPIGV